MVFAVLSTLVPVVLIAVGLTGAQIPAAPSSVAETKILIDRIKQEAAQEEKSWAEEVAREKEAEARRRKRYDDFIGDRRRIEQGIVDQEEGIKKVLARMEGLKNRQGDLENRMAHLSQSLRTKAQELRDAMDHTFPYRKEKRLESVNLLLSDIEGQNISPEEAFNRLWVFYQNEKRMAGDAEVYTGDFDGDGGAEPIQVKYLRVGKQVLAFSNMDGTKLGLMRKNHSGLGYTWIREDGLEYGTRQALKGAIATAENKAVPGFVNVPVWKESFQAAQKTQAQAVPGNGDTVKKGAK